MKKISLLLLALTSSLIVFAQKEDVNTTSNDTVMDGTDKNWPEIFIEYETAPAFPGGQLEMFKFIQENLKYPKLALKNNIQGRSICQFTVEKDGSITDVKVVRSSGNKSLDRAAIRVVKMMPKWTPGRIQGKITRMVYTLPVKFTIP